MYNHVHVGIGMTLVSSVQELPSPVVWLPPLAQLEDLCLLLLKVLSAWLQPQPRLQVQQPPHHLSAKVLREEVLVLNDVSIPTIQTKLGKEVREACGEGTTDTLLFRTDQFSILSPLLITLEDGLLGSRAPSSRGTGMQSMCM